MDLREENRQKLYELRPECHDTAGRWLDRCFDLGKEFRILEVFRPQERQAELFLIGRRGIAGESPVTWTLHSKHTLRLAADILPTTCSHKELASIGAIYGITHPLPIDPPHYEFDQVRSGEPFRISVQEKMKTLLRAISRAQGAIRNMLRLRLERFRRLSSS